MDLKGNFEGKGEPQDLYMEVFCNGKSIGIVDLPYSLFDTKSGIFFAFNVYPQTYIKVNTG